MAKTSAMYEKNEQRTDDRTDLRGLSDQQLIEGCLEGNGKENRSAWNEFFRRFIPCIKEGIREQLKSCRRLDLCYNQDVLLDIHEKIVIKLYSRSVLRQCTNPSGARSWLKTVAHNQTIDWLMEQGRKKRLPQRQAENSMVSLSAPLWEDCNLTIGDTIAASPKADEELTVYVENVLDTMVEIQNQKKLWVLRLGILLHLPLSCEELDELAIFTGRSVDTLQQRLTEMMKGVEAKEEKRINAAGKAVLLWHEIRRMEALLHEKNKDFTRANKEEIQKLEREIEEKSKKREEWLKEARKLCRPSNRNIAELVGIPEEKANQISNILIRAREALQRFNVQNPTKQ
jgi:DNA-directed RNA polymerase specialized sigma24 family protein